MRKKIIPKKTKRTYKKRAQTQKIQYSKGALGAGTAYALLAMLLIMGAAALMIGDVFPKSTPAQSGQIVIITTNTPQPQKSNLQLYTFPGATYTPTPTATPTPQPQKNTPGGHGGGGGGGGGGSNSCLIAGTKILMADGKTQKNIETIRAGEEVMGYDTTHKRFTPETVLATDHPLRDHHYMVILADGDEIGLTREHPLYSEYGWASIDPASTLAENPNLRVTPLLIGDSLLESSGKYVKIVAMNYIPGTVQTYNLKNVTGYNDFIANGIVTHNKGGGGGGGGGSSGGGPR